MPKVPEEPVCLAPPSWQSWGAAANCHDQPLVCVRHSAQRWQRDIFPVHCGLAQGISGNPHGSSTVPAVPNPEQAVQGCCCLHCETPAAAGRLAKRRESRRAVPLPGECFRPIAHIAAFLGCADSPSPCSWGSHSLPQHFCGLLFLENILETLSIMPSSTDIYRASSSS